MRKEGELLNRLMCLGTGLIMAFFLKPQDTADNVIFIAVVYIFSVFFLNMLQSVVL